MKTLYDFTSEAQGLLLEIEVALANGTIPILEDLQGKHPEFAEESVFRCLEELRDLRDQAGTLEKEIRDSMEAAKDIVMPTTFDSAIARVLASAYAINKNEGKDLLAIEYIASVLKIEFKKDL